MDYISISLVRLVTKKKLVQLDSEERQLWRRPKKEKHYSILDGSFEPLNFDACLPPFYFRFQFSPLSVTTISFIIFLIKNHLSFPIFWNYSLFITHPSVTNLQFLFPFPIKTRNLKSGHLIFNHINNIILLLLN